MEKIYNIFQYEEGDLITQDGLFLTTQGVFIDVDLITQDGSFLLTQDSDILQGRVFDTDNVFNIGYKKLVNIDRSLKYQENNKVQDIQIMSKIYKPTISEKIYGN